MVAGRPKDQVEERLPEGWQERLYELAEQGASDVELRNELGISHSLWYRWLEEDETFSQTIKRCHAMCHSWWESTGRKMAAGIQDGNATVWIFNMKNRFKWVDKVETAITGADGGPVDVNHTISFVQPK